MRRLPSSRVRRPGLRAVLAASLVSTIGVLPVFMLGALAVLVRAELAFTEVQLGVAVSVFWAAAALCSVPGGRVAERLGGRGALALAAGVSGLTLAGAATAASWTILAAWLVVGGVGNALSQVAANLRLADAVAPGRQGLAFGIKQAAVPAATLLGGIAVPAIALPLGWRWAFGVGALTAAALAMIQLQRGEGPRSRRPLRKPRVALARRPLIVLGVAAAFGAAAANAMAAFIVEYAVAVGVRAGPAGLVLAIGGAAAIAVRVLLGWGADRRARNLLVVTAMLGAGAAAVAAFPLVSSLAGLVAVTVVAYAVGWGWPGLFHFTVVRRNPQAPAAATGVTQSGVYVGGVSGPMAFGFLVAHHGYAVAWRTAAASLLIAAALMFVGRLLARRVWLPSQGLRAS